MYIGKKKKPNLKITCKITHASYWRILAWIDGASKESFKSTKTV